eukprot:gene20012-25986_t
MNAYSNADLDQPWLPSEGGALELYPLDESTIIDHGANGGKQGLPQCIPTKSILPSDTISDGNNIDLWDSGDVGGFECYIESSTDENNQSIEAAEVYQSDKNDDNELLSISPNNNMLTIVLRDENVMKFVKYVSYNAPGSRWDITTEYDIDLEHLKDNSTSEDSDNDDDSDNEDDDPMDEDEL